MPIPAEAREVARQHIDISAGQLTDALAELSRETRVSIGTEGSLPHRRTPAVTGTMSIETALKRLLSGTGYLARKVGPTAWRIEPIRTAQLPPPAQLESAVPDRPPDDPIVVTGSKRRIALADLPIDVRTLSIGADAAVQSSPASGTQRIAYEIEGLTLTASGSGRNRMFLRGVADSPFNGESQSTVAVVLDDARLTYAAPDPDIALVDMERVEVLKGPQGALYGTGALGGIYHLVSHRASLDANSLEVTAGGEFVAGGGQGYSVSAVANLALAQDRLGLRLVAFDREQPGWLDTGERTDSNSERLTGFRAGMGLDAGGGWRLDVTGFAQWRDANDSRYVYAPGARARADQFPEPHDNDLRHASMRLAREGDGADIVLSSGITSHEVGDQYDATIGAQSFGLLDPQILDAAREYRVWDNEIRFSGRSGGLGWLLGASALQARQHGLWTLIGSDGGLVIDRSRRKTTDLALFGDLAIELFDTFSLDAGVRLFHGEVRDSRADPEGGEERALAHTGFTPSLALSWRPDATRLAFLRYGSAIRQGGLSTNAQGEPGPLEGDELATLEAGWRQEFGSDGHLDLNAYYTTWENVQSDVLRSNGLLSIRNAGDARIRGVEATYETAIARNWNLSLGATLQQARLVRDDMGSQVVERRLPTIPDYVVRAAVGRQFDVAGADASLRLNMRYVGAARLTFDPQTDRSMGNYLESRLEGRLDFRGFQVTLALENLLQRSDDVFPFGNPLRFSTQDQFTPQEPFTGSVELRAQF